jgi:hypothetical protein
VPSFIEEWPTNRFTQWDPTSGWFATKQAPAAVFDMTANYIQSHNQMEARQPTRLHDLRWTEELPATAK